MQTFEGEPGRFTATLSDGSVITASSVILATGFTHFDSINKPEWGFGTFPDVVTTTQVEQMISSRQGVRCPSDGREPKRVAILLCVGSRDRQIGREWCSKICCTVSANLAMEIREELPNCHVYIYYMDIRTFGLLETKYYWRSQEEFKVKYIKARIAEVTSDGKQLIVKGEDTLVKRPITIPFDMVVHAIGMDPNVDNMTIVGRVRRRAARANGFIDAQEHLRDHGRERPSGRVRRRRGDRAGDDRRFDCAGSGGRDFGVCSNARSRAGRVALAMAKLTWLRSDGGDTPQLERPQLHLSGPLLAEAFQLLAKGSEAHGGVERYIEALKFKAALFQDALGPARPPSSIFMTSSACAPSWRPCAGASLRIWGETASRTSKAAS